MSPAPDERVLLLLTTLPEAEASSVVRGLVERRVIACGNILPGLTSIYRWDGRIVEEREAMVWMETTQRRLPALRAAVADTHPYEVPKLLVLSPEDFDDGFGAWVRQAVHAQGEGP